MKIFLDLIVHFLKTGEFNSFYYAYGLNIRGSNSKKYVGKREINKFISKYSKIIRSKLGTAENIGYDIVTKDKFYLTSLLQNHDIPVIGNISLISRGKIINSDTAENDLDHLFEFEFPFVIKNTILEYNEGLLLMEKIDNKYFVNGRILDNKENLFQVLRRGNWVVQNLAKPSSQIRKINDTALNTTRIVTILVDDRPEFLAGFQAFATNGQLTDNWGKGAIYVGFNCETEELMKYGYYHPDYNDVGVVTEHPDSKVKFEGYKIPGISAAVALCIKAHRYLYYTFIIGWDVAITDEGPKILEANEKPGMNAIQCINGGLKSKLENIQI